MVGGAAAVGAAHDRRSFGTVLDDNNIELTAYDLLNKDRDLTSQSRVILIVHNGVALLIGETLTAAMKARAAATVNQVEGVQRLVNDLAVEERARFLAILVKESERLTRLINQVLDLAKLESGAAEWQNVTLDLREIVDEAVNTTSGLFKVKKVKLDVSLPMKAVPVVADRDRLMQVMLNLLSNAIKFCDADHGKVSVTVSHLHDFVQVDVRDNGTGIAKKDQVFIFEKFRQVGDTLTDKPAGTGLGLAICRQIVGHFGGRLWVNSDYARGATFSFSLPVTTMAVE